MFCPAECFLSSCAEGETCEHLFPVSKATVCDSERKRGVTDEDEALEEERKKNLSILQSVLGSSQQTCSSKTAGKAKTFRSASHAQSGTQPFIYFCIYFVLNIKLCVFAETSRRCITTPAERSTLRLRPKLMKPRRGTDTETMNAPI